MHDTGSTMLIYSLENVSDSALTDLQAYSAFGSFLGNANAQQAQLKTTMEQTVASKDHDAAVILIKIGSCSIEMTMQMASMSL